MILIPRRQRWRRKPRYGDIIDYNRLPELLAGYFFLPDNVDRDNSKSGTNPLSFNTGVYNGDRLSFNGSSQYAEPTNYPIGSRTTYSIEVKCALLGNPSSDQPIYSGWASGATSERVMLWFDSTAFGSGYPGSGNTKTLTFEPGIAESTARVATASNYAVQNAEYHFICTYDGSSYTRLYDKTGLLVEKLHTRGATSAPTERRIARSGILSAYGNISFEFILFYEHALTETEIERRLANPYYAFRPRRTYIPLFPAAGGADVTISADPLTSLNTLAGSPVIDVAHSANTLTSSNTLTGQQVTDVSIGATPLASVNALAGDFVVDVAVLAGSLTSLNTLAGSPVIDVTVAAGALTSLNTLVGTAQVGGDVNITADVLSSLNTLAGAVVIDATVAAETLTSLNTLAGTVSLGGDVNIAADPLTSLNALTGSSVIDAVISTTPLTSVNTLAGVASTVTNVTVNAEALTSLNTLAGIPVIDVIVAANPFASVNTLAGAYSAGAAFNANINTAWTGTLNLPGETPTLTLDAENLTLDLPGEP